MQVAKDPKVEAQESLQEIQTIFHADFALMDEVLSFVEGIFATGKTTITKTRGLSPTLIDVIFTIVTKACKTFRAIQAVCRAGCGQDASILLRAQFESTIALLYILQRDTRRRTILFAAHESQRKLVLIEEARKTPGQKRRFKKAALAHAQKTVDDWKNLVPAKDVDAVRKHWAGPGGLESAVKKLGSGWRRTYMMYRYLSAFSHGSDVTAHILRHPRTGSPVFKLLPGTDELNRVIPMACALLVAMMNRLSRRLGLGLESQVKALDDKIAAFTKRRAAERQQRAQQPTP
jgi:hypothetical protein